MPRGRRNFLLIAGSLVALVLAVYAVAYFLIPKDFVQTQAMRMASRMQGGTVRWQRLETGFQGLSLGARLRGVTFRMPAEGDGAARLQARVEEVFVSFHILPLLLRRVEVKEARVSGAGIAMTEHDQPPGKEEVAEARQSFTFRLPRLEFDRVDIRNRDRYGSGIDLRGMKGFAELDGPLSDPTALRVEAEAESLFWKPSARAAAMRLPSPLKFEGVAEPRDKGARYEITRGDVALGSLTSTVGGSIRKPTERGGPYGLALVIMGKPQEIRSDDEDLRGVTPPTPAAWSATASWRIDVTGTSAAMIQNGKAVLQPLNVAAGSNRFTLGRVDAGWQTTADKRLTAKGTGSGSGVSLAFEARGSTEPGGSMSGRLTARAPATRLNGVIPNTPTWTAGSLGVGATFSLDPPAEPSVRWTVTGNGLTGTVKGLQRPVTDLGFHIDGDMRTAAIRSMNATVGSTRASLTGTVTQGKPLGTGSFQASMNRFIAEEWASPEGSGGDAKRQPSESGAAAPASIPLRSFDATVTIGEARSGKLLIRNISTPVRFADDDLIASPIRGEIGTGTIAGKLEVRNITTAPSYSLTMEVRRAPVRELAQGILPMSLGMTGFANGDIAIAGTGLPGMAAMTSLQGSLSGTVEEGRILETPAIRSLRNALGIVSQTAGADYKFKALTYAARIADGKLLLSNLGGEVEDMTVAAQGAVGFDRSVDLDLLLLVASQYIKPGTVLATFSKYARDEQGRLPVKVRMTGNLGAPKFSIKPATTLEAAGAGLAKDIFGRILNRNRSDTTRAAPADTASGTDTTRAAAEAPKTPARSDTAAPEPLKKAQEALEKIFGR
jgi:AsmA-like C-terminal region